MPRAEAAQSERPRAAGHLLAVLVFALALSIALGRLTELFAAPAAPAPASAQEAALLGVLEPITGPGQVRLTLTRDGAATHLFILLDSASTADRARLPQIATAAAGLDLAGGDRVELQEAAFAQGVAGRPDLTGWIEAAALILLCFTSGLVCLQLLFKPQARLAPHMPHIFSPPAHIAAPEPRTLTPVTPSAAAPRVADIARREPHSTAQILRGWMAGQGDA